MAMDSVYGVRDIGRIPSHAGIVTTARFGNCCRLEIGTATPPPCGIRATSLRYRPAVPS